MDNKVWGPKRNFLICAVHPVYRRTPLTHFKGTVPEVKVQARKVLGQLTEPGWVVLCQTDGQVIYCERKLPDSCKALEKV